eukprot:2230394-Amphidinium_carterae.1
MAPKAKAKAKAKGKAKARARQAGGRALPDLPPPLAPEVWYQLPGQHAVVEQLKGGQILQID